MISPLLSSVSDIHIVNKNGTQSYSFAELLCAAFLFKSLKMQTIIDKNRYLVIDAEPFILPRNDKAVVICYLDGENGITRFLKIARLPVVEHQIEFAVCLEDIA